MSALAILAAVVVVVVLVTARERRIYKANKAFRVTAVQLVSPPGPRWWQVALSNLLWALITGSLLVALFRLVPTDDTMPGPSTPLDGSTDGATPAGPTGHAHPATSTSTAPKGASR